ncbi:LamG domain-containing protein [Candidatus Pelagibacter sp.]|nr:LamG domain-containing protein [Candidatus Pelagibacter sp.]
MAVITKNGYFGTPPTVANGLLMSLDAANPRSYVSGSTIWRDLSGNNKSGSLVSSSYDPTNGGGIVFNGTTSNFTFPTITVTNTYTLEIVGNITGPIDTTIANRRTILGNNTNVSEINSTSNYFAGLTVDSSTQNYNFGFASAGSIVQNSTFHWVFTLDSSKIVRMYFNGKSTTSPDTQLTSFTTVTRTFNNFGVFGGARYYVGNLYIAKIYNRALTQTEVTQNYNATKVRFNIT